MQAPVIRRLWLARLTQRGPRLRKSLPSQSEKPRCDLGGLGLLTSALKTLVFLATFHAETLCLYTKLSIRRDCE